MSSYTFFSSVHIITTDESNSLSTGSMIIPHGGLSVKKCLTLGGSLNHPTFITNNTFGWYNLGTISSIKSQTVTDITILCNTDYISNINTNSKLILNLSLNNNNIHDKVSNVNGVFYSFGLTEPLSTQIKLVQNEKNKLSYDIFAYLQPNSTYSTNVLSMEGTSFSPKFILSNDPGVNSSIVQNLTEVFPISSPVLICNTTDTTIFSEGSVRIGGGLGVAGNIAIGNEKSIICSATGLGIPIYNTRSPGTKFVLFPVIGTSSVDYAIGMETGNLWFSTENSATGFKWFAGTNLIMKLEGNGQCSISKNLILGNVTNTPTLSNKLSLFGIKNNLSTGPHMAFGFNGDSNLSGHLLFNDHNDIIWAFDSWHNGEEWISSSFDSNFCIQKSLNNFNIQFDSRVPNGSAVTWKTSLSIYNNGIINVKNTTDATSIYTGALQIDGGVGIRKTLYVEKINISSNSVINFGSGSQIAEISSDSLIIKGPTNSSAVYIQACLLPKLDNSFSCGNPLHKWTTVYSTNGIVQVFDERKCKRIEDLHLGLDFIKDISPKMYQTDTSGLPISFDSKFTENTNFGLSAQNILQTLEKYGIDKLSGLFQLKDGSFMINYSQFIPPLYKAIQDLDKLLSKNEQEISKLQKELELLKSLVSI